MPQNIRKSFADYVSGEPSTMVFSYDIYIPEGTESTERSIDISFGLDMAGSGTYKRIVRDLYVRSTVVDGIIGFSTDRADDDTTGETVSGSVRSETREVPSNEWINVKYVLELTHEEEQYYIKVWGIYENDVIYKAECTIGYADYNEDGDTDNLGVEQTAFYITPDDNTESVISYFDNIYFDKDNNFDWSAINKNAWENSIVEISADGDGNINVYAENAGEALESGILVMAIYNENGALVENGIITSTDLKDGVFSYEIPAEKVTGAKLVKAFVFDTLTAATPLMPNGAYIIE